MITAYLARCTIANISRIMLMIQAVDNLWTTTITFVIAVAVKVTTSIVLLVATHRYIMHFVQSECMQICCLWESANFSL